jgi:hypothetical protein
MLAIWPIATLPQIFGENYEESHSPRVQADFALHHIDNGPVRIGKRLREFLDVTTLPQLTRNFP